MRKFTLSILVLVFGAFVFITGAYAQQGEVKVANERSLQKLSVVVSQKPEVGQDDRDRGCDTLRFPLHGTIVYYTVNAPDYGYVTGNNSFGDLTKAEYFELEGESKYVHKVLFDFAIAKHTSGQNPNITFNIWNGTPGHEPGNVLGSEYIPLSDIVADVQNEQMTEIIFNPAIMVEDVFYAGVNLPQSTGDTLAIWSNTNGNTSPGTAWEQWDTGEWYSIEESWGGLSFSQAVHPVVCDESGIFDGPTEEVEISVYPNPTSGSLNIDLSAMEGEDLILTVYNAFGQKVQEIEHPKSNMGFLTLNLGNQPRGIYIIRVDSKDKVAVQKISII